jgi:hypothetical protein
MIPKGYMTKIGAAGLALGIFGSLLTDFANGQLTAETLMEQWKALSVVLIGLGLRRAIG